MQANCQNIDFINRDIKRTRSVVVALGDSFTEGDELGTNDSTDPSLSFVNVLCTKYLDNRYTAINFGQAASGNTAAIMRLFLQNVNWHECEHIQVIFCPSSMHRFDVIDDTTDLTIGTEFKTLWGFMCPHLDYTRPPWRDIHTIFGQSILSTRWEAIHTLLLLKILNLWCESRKANLLIFPAFYPNMYKRDYFHSLINQSIKRNKDNQLITDQFHIDTQQYDHLLDNIPWDKIISIDQASCFFDLCARQEPDYEPKKDIGYYASRGKISEGGWLMPRGHPSSKGHDLLASKLALFIK
jgi:hypothetical protein